MSSSSTDRSGDMITVCLTATNKYFVKKRKIQKISKQQTVQQLLELACSAFDMKQCTLTRGYPPVTIQPDDATMKSTVVEVGIQDQDLITVIEQETPAPAPATASTAKTKTKIAEASAEGSSSLDDPPKINSYIPGLTKSYFTSASRLEAETMPTLLMGRVDDTSFGFAWNAPGSNGNTYRVSASGNIANNDFRVECDCPHFKRLSGQKAERKYYQSRRICVTVCKHLGKALNSVLDPNVVELLDNDSDEGTKKQKPPPPKRARNDTKNANNIVDLLDDDSDAATDQKPLPPKRARKTTSNANKASHELLVTSKKSNIHHTAVTEAPIKLFATRQDLSLRQQTSRSHWCWTQCQTLREMLLTEGNSIQFLVIANFLIDFGYLLQQVPELLSIPHVVVFYGSANPGIWKSAMGPFQTVDFIELNPSAEPGSASNPLRWKFFGCHHTKMFLVGHSNKIRVVVHTANIGEADTGLKANAAFIQDFPLATEDSEPSNDFESTLVHYMESYRYSKKQNWTGQGSELLTDALRRYDYSSAQAILIPSVPGYHRLDGKHRQGHLKVRQAVAQFTPDTSMPRPTVCQFSSIGNLSKKTLLEFQTSMDRRLARRGEEKGDQELRLKVVWPTTEEIRLSVEGVMGGGSVPGKKKCISKPFLKPLMHKWSTARRGNSNPLQKGENVPHIKSYYQNGTAEGSMDWLVIASHNLSTAAWGQIRKDKAPRNSYHHYVGSWELGVFLSPEVLGTRCLVHWRKREEEPGTVTVPLPYNVVPEAYSAGDEPWTVDGMSANPAECCIS